MKEMIKRFLEWLGLVRYKTRTNHKHHYHTIKKPENDCTLYKKSVLDLINELKAKGKTDKQIGKIIGRTEGAIRQERWRQKNILCKFCRTTKQVRTLDGRSWATVHKPDCQVLMNSTTTI